MFTNKDKHYALKRKKVWDVFGWNYKNSLNFLSKNGSLNIYCAIDKYRTYLKRYENKQKRLKNRQKLRRDLKQIY